MNRMENPSIALHPVILSAHNRREDAPTARRALHLNPLDRHRLEFGIHGAAGVLTAAPFESADDANMHVVIDEDLARESRSGSRHAFRREDIAFGLCHRRWLAADELDAAGCAFCLAAAGVKLIGASLFDESEHEALSSRDFKGAGVFDGEFWHGNPTRNDVS